jgi:hypothetical protein
LLLPIQDTKASAESEAIDPSINDKFKASVLAIHPSIELILACQPP